MKKCKNADNYKGLRKPTCNKGDGCNTCRQIWESKTYMYQDDISFAKHLQNKYREEIYYK